MKNSLTCTSEKVHLSQPVLPIPTNNEVHVRTEHSSLYARVFICYIAFISVNRDCITAIQFSYSNQSSNPPRHLTFLKIIIKKTTPPPHPSQNAVQRPHCRVHSGDQMPPPQKHFTGPWMTEGWQKRLQFSNKIFKNTANNSHSM